MSNWPALKEDSMSPRAIAMQRRLAVKNGTTLASQVVTALQHALTDYQNQSDPLAYERLMAILRAHRVMSRLDPTLSQELAQNGSHLLLLKLLSIPHHDEEGDDESIESLQDVACEIASYYAGSFPVKAAAPFTLEEVRQRLPIEFILDHGPATILMHQVVTMRQTAQEDVGFVLWPSAVYLARWLERNQHILTSDSTHTILELGSGCGLCGLVAAQLTSSHSEISTILTDFNGTVLQNLERNVDLNDLQSCRVVGLDFYQQDGGSSSWVDLSGQRHAQVDLVLGADIICQPADAIAAAKTLSDTLRPGASAYIVCANAQHRFGIQCFPDACRDMKLDISIANIDLQQEVSSNARLRSDLEKSCGYVDGMNLQMFTIRKL